MPKFCSQCGSQISDDSTFCANCGNRMDDAVNTTETVSTNDAPSADSSFNKGVALAKGKIGAGIEKFKTNPKRDKYIGFAAVVIVAIVVLCVLYSLIFGGYKGAVREYMNAKEDGYNLYKPDFLSYKADIDYDIIDSEKFDEDELDGLQEYLENIYKNKVDKDIKVSKAYEVEVKVKTTIKTDGDKDTDKDTRYLIVAKVNGDWAVVDESSKSQIKKYNDDSDYDYDDYDDYDY